MSHSVSDGPRPRRGRPPALSSEARERLILAAMERVVAAVGLRRSSMAAIAREAGMSKRTLYEAFPSRDALFAGWVRGLRATVVRPLGGAERALPLAERLKRLLRYEGGGADNEMRLTVLRAVIAEAPQNRPIAQAFAQEGHDACLRIIADELERARAAGEIVVQDVFIAAAVLHDMARSNPLPALLAAQPIEAALAQLGARLDAAIDIFLNGVAPAHGSGDAAAHPNRAAPSEAS